jgi:hypothetical protein
MSGFALKGLVEFFRDLEAASRASARLHFGNAVMRTAKKVRFYMVAP